MLPRIMVFEEVVSDDIKQRGKNADDRGSMQDEATSCQAQPRATAHRVFYLGTSSHEVAERTA